MGVRFVVGRAGTGRSRHCFDAIVSAMRAEPFGPAIYWILPRQATFSAERELTVLSGLGAFCRARVLSFELLGEEVLSSYGGSAIPQISAVGRRMLLGRLLRSHRDELTFFRNVARQPGLAARLDAVFAEFQRCGVGAPELEVGNGGVEVGSGETQVGSGQWALGSENAGTHAAVNDQQSTINNQLSSKLHDFRLLYQAYRDALGEERVDPHRRLEQVLECISDHAPLRNASVYVDDFREFTQRERRMIVALAQTAASVDITLLVDPDSPTLRDPHHLPDELNLFHHTETQYRRLALDLQEAGVAMEPMVRLRQIRRTSDPALLAVERMYDRVSGIGPRDSGKDISGSGASDPRPETRNPKPESSVQFIEAPDRRGEVDAVARRIRASLQDGLRLRDIAVLVRDIDEYEPLIAAAFGEHGIPYFVDRRRAATHHPLLQFIRSALRIARSDWDHDAVMELLKSGLTGLSPSQVDDLENYVLLHRIHGPAWNDSAPWRYEGALSRADADDTDALREDQALSATSIDALRRQISRPVGAFVNAVGAGGERSVRQIIVAIFELLEAFKARRILAGWIERATVDNDPELRGEHEQVWSQLIELFDQMSDLLGDDSMSLGDFIEVLDVGLEQFDLAIPPPRVDQVLVGTVDRTRTPALHTVFVMGLSEGQFPKTAREDPMLADAEREFLRTRYSLEVDPDSARRQLDERLLAYIGFTSASRRLVVTRAMSHDEKPVNPSIFWRQLTELLPEIKPEREERAADGGPQFIGTPRQLVTALMRWARGDDKEQARQPILTALYQFLATHSSGEDPIGVMRDKAWRALRYVNKPALSPEVAARFYAGGLTASVTRIESFAACPFQHFARYNLRLQPRQTQEVTSMDLGTVYHGILERVVKQVLKEKRDWCEIEPKITREMIADFAAEVGATLREEIMLSSARNQYLLGRIEKTLGQVCASQQAALSRGKFRPAFAELNFGIEDDQASLPALTLKTPGGRELRLQGKIDRVDLAVGSDLVAVIDYKTRKTTLSLLRLHHGLSLQLLTYLLVLQSCGRELFKKKVSPVAAFYAQLLREPDRTDHPDEATAADDPLFDLRWKPRGIFDFGAIHDLDTSLETGTSEVVHCQVKQDGGIGNFDKSDAATSEDFTALLRYVEKRIGELADAMIGGKIEPRPYRIGTETPCSRCDYRSVCRFDPDRKGHNRYLHVQPMSRQEVLKDVMDKGGRHGR